MGPPSVGGVVIIPFPYSDLTKSKLRSALVLAEVGRGDFLICQISSQQYCDLHALLLNDSGFVSGGINLDSFIRGLRLHTDRRALFLGVVGHLTHSKVSEVIGQLVDMRTEVVWLSWTPSASKDDASPSRPFQPQGGLMDSINASLQRGRQG
jgi:mRNA interferase MazF